MQATSRTVLVLRWAARLLALAMLLFWGQFFVVHLAWFRPPFPPPWVFGVQALHLAMLAGLALGWRYELAGAAVVIGSAVPFFLYAAGPNAAAFIAMTCAPALLWIAVAWVSNRRDGNSAERNDQLSVR